MSTRRPVNLNLLTIRFPVTAIASILHRISGVILFLLIPMILWLLHKSLSSLYGFHDALQIVRYPLIRFMSWVTLSALFYHLVAGIKHLFMDLGYGEELKSASIVSYVVIVSSVVVSLLIGIWLW